MRGIGFKATSPFTESPSSSSQAAYNRELSDGRAVPINLLNLRHLRYSLMKRDLAEANSV
jgi:hypothetical protein